MMVCPNCGRTVTDESMGFCPACGHSFVQQPNQPYPQYGPRPYGPSTYSKKNGAVAIILSFFIPGLGQIYVGKIKRGVAYILTAVLLSVISSALTIGIDYNDIQAVNDFILSPSFIVLVLISLGFWLFSMYDAYRLTTKYNEASMRNDLPRFLKDF